jgi:hypothetical protein
MVFHVAQGSAKRQMIAQPHRCVREPSVGAEIPGRMLKGEPPAVDGRGAVWAAGPVRLDALDSEARHDGDSVPYP